MFVKLIMFTGLVGFALTAPPPSEKPVEILDQNVEVNPDGSYGWNYSAADGTSQQQNGEIQGTGEAAAEAVQGSAAWTDPEGNEHVLSYTAGANGYQPQSADLPVAPAIPEAIVRSLEWNAAHPEEAVV